MKFERGNSAKKVLGIGLDPRPVHGIAFVKNIDYADFGETWNWKFIEKKRKRRIRKVLERLRDGKYNKIVHVSTPTGSLGNLADSSPDESLAGKLLVFDGVKYLMPDEV